MSTNSFANVPTYYVFLARSVAAMTLFMRANSIWIIAVQLAVLPTFAALGQLPEASMEASNDWSKELDGLMNESWATDDLTTAVAAVRDQMEHLKSLIPEYAYHDTEVHCASQVRDIRAIANSRHADRYRAVTSAHSLLGLSFQLASLRGKEDWMTTDEHEDVRQSHAAIVAGFEEESIKFKDRIPDAANRILIETANKAISDLSANSSLPASAFRPQEKDVSELRQRYSDSCAALIEYFGEVGADRSDNAAKTAAYSAGFKLYLAIQQYVVEAAQQSVPERPRRSDIDYGIAHLQPLYAKLYEELPAAQAEDEVALQEAWAARDRRNAYLVSEEARNELLAKMDEEYKRDFPKQSIAETSPSRTKVSLLVGNVVLIIGLVTYLVIRKNRAA